jgi:hypothetical protein
MLYYYPHPQCCKLGRLPDSRRGIATMSAALHYKVQCLETSILLVFYNQLARKSCCPGPWTHTNNPGPQLDSALGRAACNFQAVPLLGATALLITTTPIKIPLSQSNSSLLEATVIVDDRSLYLRLRLTRSPPILEYMLT